MITSPVFLKIAGSSQSLFISTLLSNLSIKSIIIKCVFSDPNYGGCWFAAKSFPLSTAEEVLLSSIPLIAISREPNVEILSTNKKPLVTFQGHAIKNGSQLFEMDTRKSYKYDEENHKWWPLNP